MEHRLIQGGEQFLPFARSRITNLKKLGLAYADQSYEVDGVSIKVRIQPGHEYIRIAGGGGYASVFSNVQVSETVAGTSLVAGVVGAKVSIGTFPPTLPEAYPVTGKTRFGTSPYSSHSLRLARPIYTPDTTYAGRVGYVQHLSVFADGVKIEDITRTSAFAGDYFEEVVRRGPDGSYLGASGGVGYTWNRGRTEIAHCTNSSSLPVMATMETDCSSTVGSHYSNTSVIESPTDGAGDFSESATRISGVSFIKVRRLSTEGLISTYSVASLGYAYAAGARIDGVSGMDGVYSDTFTTVTNDFECNLNHRRWHALDRTSVSPRGVVFVLRETSELSSHLKTLTYAPTVPTPPIYANSVNRGYSLSFVTPAGAVYDHVAATPIGRHGYIEAVVPTSDDKKVYVYYALHDDAYPVVDTPETFDVRAPVNYIEYLDEYSVTKGDDGGYSVTKTRTVTLGPVTLRTWDVLRPQLDHYESKLHGAALEVKGFIWADRFCYEVARNAFYPIPNYDELVPDVYHGEVNAARDQITGPDNDRTSYLCVSPDGLVAVYLLIGFSKVRRFRLSALNDAGMRQINLESEDYIQGWYSTGELLNATSVKFNRPSR